ncbi:C40 family peptidase [Romboutsia sp.]|uniref:C40 family peptidase n=1 Tax=Romboutsia sp. TaxID=1965302 RepID=UPI003F2D236E
MKVILRLKNLLLGIILLNLSFIFFDNSYAYEYQYVVNYDNKIINEVIYLAKDKVGLEYVWGGKGEIMTHERLNELIDIYGSKHYPLEKNNYIGQQAFDCSGLTYWAYKKVTGVKIGYSTVEQKEVLKNYKVDMNNLQPGDLIFTPGHVVLYTGNGKMVNAASKRAYPKGGIKEDCIFENRNCEAYRPIDYIKDVR